MKNPGIYRNELELDGNFTTVDNTWIRNSGLSPQANFLWIYLLSHRVGYELRDSQILRETGFGRKGLRAARNELVESGWLELERIKNADGSLGTYAYHLKESRDPSGTVAQGTVEQGTVAQGSHLRKPITNNTNDRENYLESSFAQFWSVYPKKDDRRAAFRAFKRALDRADLDTIVSAAERYRDDPNRELAYTKNGATWLNADAWDNDPLPARTRRQQIISKAEENIARLRELEKGAK